MSPDGIVAMPARICHNSVRGAQGKACFRFERMVCGRRTAVRGRRMLLRLWECSGVAAHFWCERSLPSPLDGERGVGSAYGGQSEESSQDADLSGM